MLDSVSELLLEVPQIVPEVPPHNLTVCLDVRQHMDNNTWIFLTTGNRRSMIRLAAVGVTNFSWRHSWVSFAKRLRLNGNHR